MTCISHFREFYGNFHQDVDIDYGNDIPQMIYGVAFSFHKRDVMWKILSELESLQTDDDFKLARKISEEQSCIYLVEEGTEREDILVIRTVIEQLLEDNPRTWVDLNHALDRMGREAAHER